MMPFKRGDIVRDLRDDSIYVVDRQTDYVYLAGVILEMDEVYRNCQINVRNYSFNPGRLEKIGEIDNG
jgi:hypothetical protein